MVAIPRSATPSSFVGSEPGQASVSVRQTTERSWVTIERRVPARRSSKKDSERRTLAVPILNFLSSGEEAGGRVGSPSHPVEEGPLILGGRTREGRIGLPTDEAERGDAGGVCTAAGGGERGA